MDPMTIALLAGGALGALQGYDKNQRAKKDIANQRKVEAVKAKWYGWNKEAPQTFSDPNLLQDILQGGLQGAQVGNLIMGAYGKPDLTNNEARASSVKAQTESLPTLQAPESLQKQTPLGPSMQPAPSPQMPMQLPAKQGASLTPTSDITKTAWWKLLPLEDKKSYLGG